jgi:hypothetical protein
MRMASIERRIYSKIKNQLLAKEKLIQVLVGPRQIGKTTMVQQILAEWPGPKIFVTADAVASTDVQWLEQQWNTARSEISKTENQQFLLVIDEIQKIGNWSEMVKKLWDEDVIRNLPLKVILLGSSRLLIQQGLTESLAGRFERTYLGHWSYPEMQEAFGVTLEQFVWFGGYPGAAQLMENEERWRRYVNDSLLETSISKDVLMLTQISKPALMRRLFELGSRYSGQILSFTKILGQLADAGNTVTLSRYLEMLDTAGLLGGIEKFSPDMARQRASSPKFQVHNNAMLSVLSPLTFEECRTNPKEWGRWVESAVGVHLLNQSLEQDFKLYYWRERNEEVDFVMEHRGKIVAIEVKSGAEKAMPGLKKFKDKYPSTKLYATGSSGIPLETFLNLNPMELF